MDGRVPGAVGGAGGEAGLIRFGGSVPSATLLGQSVLSGIFIGSLYGLLGLGLSLVKAIVEAHGGQVRVASKPRLGTTVELRLTSTPHANSEFGVRNSELVPNSEVGVRK